MGQRSASIPAPAPAAGADRLAPAKLGVRANKRDPLEALVAATYADVWRLCAALVDAELAEDLAQETFVRATRALQRFRGQASARTWLFAIARHVCMDELRSRHRRRRRDELLANLAERAHAGDPSGEVLANELLAQLEPDRRAAFVLTQLFRLSYDEAATVCECPTGTIRSRVARAREELIGLMYRPASTSQRSTTAPS
jgi:RNA polymerase sigma-70 factor, ECF subfamily